MHFNDQVRELKEEIAGLRLGIVWTVTLLVCLLEERRSVENGEFG